MQYENGQANEGNKERKSALGKYLIKLLDH